MSEAEPLCCICGSTLHPRSLAALEVVMGLPTTPAGALPRCALCSFLNRRLPDTTQVGFFRNDENGVEIAPVLPCPCLGCQIALRRITDPHRN